LIATFHLIPSWHTYTMSDAMHEVPGQEYFSQTVLTRYVTLARPGEGRYRAPMPKKCPQCAREQPMCTQNTFLSFLFYGEVLMLWRPRTSGENKFQEKHLNTTPGIVLPTRSMKALIRISPTHAHGHLEAPCACVLARRSVT